MAADGVSGRAHMLVKPHVKWFETELCLGADNLPDGKNSAEKLTVADSISADRVRYLEIRATSLYEHDLSLFNKYQDKSGNKSNANWIRTVLRSGTISDRMAAHTLLIQDSALHNLSSLEHLVKMVDPKGKRECIMAADTLKDIFLGDLLPPDRKLRPFDKNPLGILLKTSGSDMSDRTLLVWHFERLLKQHYIEYVQSLNKMAHDSLEATKRKGIRNMFLLLSGHGEQEQMLLRNLVNKLGDPSQKIASYSSLCLCQLVDKHPRMKGVVTAEVERLLFRANVSNKACYYAVCFLNQMILDKSADGGLAAKLITIYLALFKANTKRGDVDSRMMSALLTGVNRAFPFADLDTDMVAEQTDAIYKIIHKVTFNISVQALTLLFHILNSKEQFNDRFYCALYRKILDPELKNSSKRAMFLNLLCKTLKSDTVEARIYAFIKRILQVAAGQSPTLICGLFVMISEVLKGGRLKILLSCREIGFKDDDEERFVDAPDEDVEENPTPLCDEKSRDSIPPDLTSDLSSTGKGSWVHRVNLKSNGEGVARVSSSDFGYDPLRRNPTFAGATSSSAWELLNLTRHYHPSVALFANTLLAGNSISYPGDPLQDFTLIRFLDRFVFRNPKKLDSSKSTLIQRSVLGRRKLYVPDGARALTVNSNNYINRGEQRVPVDEHFFYRYFAARVEATKNETVGQMDDDVDDIESVASDEFDDLLDQIEPGKMTKEFDLDFAAELKNQTSAKSTKRKKGGAESDSEEENDDDEPEFDDFGDAFKDFSEDIQEAKLINLEDDDFEDESSDDEQTRSVSMSRPKKRATDFSEDEDNDDDEFDFDTGVSRSKKRKSMSESDDPSKLFASAEEFASILEENENAEIDTISAEAMSNRDNAHAKQLRWEQDRDRWLRGQDWKSKKGRVQKTGTRGGHKDRRDYAAPFKRSKKVGVSSIPKRTVTIKAKKITKKR